VDDVYSLDLETMEWKLLREARLPRSRQHHTVCFYNNAKMLLYGGSTSQYGKVGEVDTLHLSTHYNQTKQGELTNLFDYFKGAIAELGEMAFDEMKSKIRSGLSELKTNKSTDSRTEEVINDSLRMLKLQFTRLRKEHDALQRETDKLNKEREQFEASKEKMALYTETHKPGRVVKLNIGGVKYETTVSTLRNDGTLLLVIGSVCGCG